MKYSLTIGRFQPLHAGHIKLIRSVLDEGKAVCVALRNTPISDTDPYTIAERIEMFTAAFGQEMREGKLVIIVVPDIEEVFYGRQVGWKIREVRLDERTESISASAIRRTHKYDVVKDRNRNG